MALIWRKQVTDGIKLDGKASVFHQIYINQKRAIWFPEEININQDLIDRNIMSQQEKDTFTYLVWYFLTSELLVQNVIGESFYPYIIDPRAKQAMTVQMFMEDIHSDFFENILNTFSLDREYVYNLNVTDPLIKKKQERVAAAANKISISNGWVDSETLGGKKAILHAILLSSIIQEGIFFYSAFALFFAMREWGKMKNVCNGIDLVLIDESFHLQLGMELILGMLEETPELWEDVDFVDKIRNTIIECAELEFEFIRKIFDGGNRFDLSVNEMIMYLQFITDRRLEELSLPAHYHIDKNPIKFLEKQDLATLQNFFEVTSNQYTNF